MNGLAITGLSINRLLSNRLSGSWTRSAALGSLLLAAVGCQSATHHTSAVTAGQACTAADCTESDCTESDCTVSSCHAGHFADTGQWSAAHDHTAGGGPLQQCLADGCCERQPDFGPDAVPVPPGTYVNGWNDAMICAARRYDFVVSRHEWFAGGGQLGPEGRQHVARIAAELPHRPEQVIVESEPVELEADETLDEAITRTHGLNEQRRRDLIERLSSHGVLDAEQRVVLAPLDRVGTRGIEAPQVYGRLLQNGMGRGGQRGGIGGGMGGGGFGGGGFGGGSGGGFF